VAAYSEHLLTGNTDQVGSLRMTIKYLREHGLDKDIAARYQLGFVNPVDPDDEQYAGRLAIPYLTRAGIVAMKYRCVQEHKCSDHGHKKYLAPSGQESRIFNPEAFFAAGLTIGVAEGEIDAIAATERIGLPTIGIPGVDMWTQNRKVWRRTLEDFDKVIIFVDGDLKDEETGKQPGLDLARAISADMRGRARLVRCDPGEDVASTVASGRIDELREKAGL